MHRESDYLREDKHKPRDRCLTEMKDSTMKYTLLFLAGILPIYSAMAQVPQGIQPGNGDDAVSIWDHPTYVIIVVLIIAFVILGFWIRRKR